MDDTNHTTTELNATIDGLRDEISEWADMDLRSCQRILDLIKKCAEMKNRAELAEAALVQFHDPDSKKSD
jgi:hypothetical protein